MPQLQINQGPQDALLYDNSRSYFTNVGYVRTSNFQLELRDVDPQNTANLGTTVQFVIPKAADLLGPVDLMLEFDAASGGGVVGAGTGGDPYVYKQYAAWVEALGFAMIERIVFSVGSHDIETITGDQLNILNELMKGDEHRLGKTILKTGRPDVTVDVSSLAAPTAYTVTTSAANNRLIYEGHPNANVPGTTFNPGKKLIVPLGLFFSKHPSQYFPLCAVAGCNDIRISIKFRPLNELVVLHSNYTAITAKIDSSVAPGAVLMPTWTTGNPIKAGSCKLRCHYVHVTGPEATTLMNKEHVRLLKLWQVQSSPKSISGKAAGNAFSIPIDLSFLHPVQEIIITIRKASEMGSSTAATMKISANDQGARAKNYFAYQGGGSDPNIESMRNKTMWAGKTEQSGWIADENDEANSYLAVSSFKLSLNGQERHPSLASTGLDREYLMDRLMPLLHSNTSTCFSDVAAAQVNTGKIISLNTVASSTHTDGGGNDPYADIHALAQMKDRKEIYVYPFALNPEGSNPSGAVNFSKVSHAKLTIDGTAYDASTDATAQDYQIDVYGIYYNWLQIKDGRALTSFA